MPRLELRDVYIHTRMCVRLDSFIPIVYEFLRSSANVSPLFSQRTPPDLANDGSALYTEWPFLIWKLLYEFEFNDSNYLLFQSEWPDVNNYYSFQRHCSNLLALSVIIISLHWFKLTVWKFIFIAYIYFLLQYTASWWFLYYLLLCFFLPSFGSLRYLKIVSQNLLGLTISGHARSMRSNRSFLRLFVHSHRERGRRSSSRRDDRMSGAGRKYFRLETSLGASPDGRHFAFSH